MIQAISWIGVVTIQHPTEVDTIVRGIDEWIAPRRRSDLEGRPLHDVRLQRQTALDPQFDRRFAERRHGNRSAEHVVMPAQRRRRRALQTGLYQAEIVAVSWAQHKPMIAEADGAAVAVDRRMPHIEDRHRVSSSLYFWCSSPATAVGGPACSMPVDCAALPAA